MTVRRRLVPVVAGLLAAAVVALSPGTAQAGVNPGEDVFNFGDAPFKGSTGALPLNGPLVGMAATPSGEGYWLLARDGGVFGFGDAVFHGSTGSLKLNKPVVGMAADPKGRGYWFVASDGGIFAFDVPFLGSMGDKPLNQPVVGMAPSQTGGGYWLVARDGGIFSFGDAVFAGSTGAIKLNQPIVGMAADPDGAGYWFVAGDGGVFAFDAPFLGSAAGKLTGGDRVTGMAAHPSGQGYWLATARGDVVPFGTATDLGDAVGTRRYVAGITAHPGGKGYWQAVHRPVASPPEARLAGSQDSIRARLGSSCWTPSATMPGVCADVAGFPADVSILNVRQGETVTVTFGAADPPLSARLFRVGAPANDPAATRELAAAETVTFVADHPVGLHRMLLATDWVQGDVSYLFRLNVR